MPDIYTPNLTITQPPPAIGANKRTKKRRRARNRQRKREKKMKRKSLELARTESSDTGNVDQLDSANSPGSGVDADDIDDPPIGFEYGPWGTVHLPAPSTQSSSSCGEKNFTVYTLVHY